VPEALVNLAEHALLEEGAAERAGSVARVPGFREGGGGAEAVQRDELLAALKAAGSEPPTVAELAAARPDVDVAGALRLLARAGLVIPVTPDRYYEAEALASARRRLVAAVAESTTGATPSALRERLGLSRKYLIPLLEWADREGVTTRRGDVRTLGPRGVLDGQPGSA
jgi:selenocysteine-specific elongation factor